MRISELPDSDYAKSRTVRARLIFCLHRFAVFKLGQVLVLIFSPQAVALEVDAVSVVDDPVQDCIGDCGLADHVVPSRDGQSRGDD